MTENQMQGAIIELAELLGYRVYHVANVHKQLRSGTSEGYPDLHIVGHGRQIVAELKTEKGKCTVEQSKWLQELAHVAGRCAPVKVRSGEGYKLIDPVEVHLLRPHDWLSGEVERILKAGRA